MITLRSLRPLFVLIANLAIHHDSICAMPHKHIELDCSSAIFGSINASIDPFEQFRCRCCAAFSVDFAVAAGFAVAFGAAALLVVLQLPNPFAAVVLPHAAAVVFLVQLLLQRVWMTGLRLFAWCIYPKHPFVT